MILVTLRRKNVDKNVDTRFVQTWKNCKHKLTASQNIPPPLGKEFFETAEIEHHVTPASQSVKLFPLGSQQPQFMYLKNDYHRHSFPFVQKISEKNSGKIEVFSDFNKQ